MIPVRSFSCGKVLRMSDTTETLKRICRKRMVMTATPQYDYMGLYTPNTAGASNTASTASTTRGADVGNAGLSSNWKAWNIVLGKKVPEEQQDTPLVPSEELEDDEGLEECPPEEDEDDTIHDLVDILEEQLEEENEDEDEGEEGDGVDEVEGNSDDEEEEEEEEDQDENEIWAFVDVV